MEEAAAAGSLKRRRASRKSAFARQMREKGYLTTTEVVEKIQVHKTTLYRWIREGLVEALDFNGAYYVRWTSVIEHLGEVAQALGLTRELEEGKNGS
jgi:DNA invertase Pin-like site-specific DNA recombinase